MNQVVINSTTIGIVISVLGYELGMFLKRKLLKKMLKIMKLVKKI